MQLLGVNRFGKTFILDESALQRLQNWGWRIVAEQEDREALVLEAWPHLSVSEARRRIKGGALKMRELGCNDFTIVHIGRSEGPCIVVGDAGLIPSSIDSHLPVDTLFFDFQDFVNGFEGYR